MILSKKPYTTNVEAMLMALAGIAESLVVICTLGYVRPTWSFAIATKILKHKYCDDEQEQSNGRTGRV